MLAGQLANIADVEAEPLFCPEVDKETGFKTRFVHSGCAVVHSASDGWRLEVCHDVYDWLLFDL